MEEELTQVWEQIDFNKSNNLPTKDLYKEIAEIVKFRTHIYYELGE